jgi:hypothetical protein
MKNAGFWDVIPCDSGKNRGFGGMYRLHHQGGRDQRARNNVSSNSLILSTLVMEAICSNETSVLTRATRRHISEGGILLS